MPPSDGYKLHVFADLPPYLCTSNDCLNLKTFPSRRAWAEYEFAKYQIKMTYTYPDCCQIFSKKDDYVQHLVTAHKLKGSRDRQSLALIAAATIAIINPIAEQKCPLLRG